MTNTELEHLLEVSKSLDYTMYLMICTMLFTGIRAGELCAIRWNDFDQVFGSLRIDESLTDAMFESSTKTESSERIIPLTSFLQKQYSEMYEFKKPQFDDYVFINRCGRPYKTNNVDKKFRYIRKCISEIYPEDDFTDITPHCLRHTFATAGVNAGVPLKSMQALLGHADTKTLLDTYMHICYEDKRSSIKMIENNTSVKPLPAVDDTLSEYELNNKWSNVKRVKGPEN